MYEMKIINPITITPVMVTTNAVEVYPTWSAATTYNLGDRVVYSNFVYESLIASNLNKQPDTNPTNWLFVQPSNKTAAFDTSYSTQTSATDTLDFDIVAGSMYNSLAVLNILNANTLTIQVTDAVDGVVYNKTVELDGSIVVGWYDYFFADFDQLSDIVFTDIPPYGTATLSITLSGTGTVSVGNIVLGGVFEMGQTQYGVNFGIRDYSVKEEDEFGNILFVQRNYARRVEPQVLIRNSDLRKIDRLLTQIRAKPTVFIPTEEGFDTLITYGFLADWNIEIPYPANSLLRMDIKGLT